MESQQQDTPAPTTQPVLRESKKYSLLEEITFFQLFR